jgi:hypothetical protein
VEGFITVRLTAVTVKAYSCYQLCVHTKWYPTFLLRLTSHKMIGKHQCAFGQLGVNPPATARTFRIRQEHDKKWNTKQQ